MPLEDPRGDVVEHLRTWTHDQTLERERFRVVVSGNGEHPDFEQQVAELLAPQDELVVAPGAELFALYAAAAREARAPVLVFSEAHCRADPGCLAAVADLFAADPELDAATFEFRQGAPNRVGELGKRWFSRVFADRAQAGWMRLDVAGSAIRAETYARVGGLDSRLGFFAPTLMSARLQQEGIRVAHLEEATLTHELEDGLGQSLTFSRSFAQGECLARSEHDPEFCEQYLGPAGLWGRRLAYRPEVARTIVAALASATRHSPREAGWLTRELVARLPARVAGPRPRQVWESATARWHQAVACSAVAPEKVRWRSYVAARERTVRATELRQVAKGNALPAAPAANMKRVAPASNGLLQAEHPHTTPFHNALGAEALDGVLVGAHGVEHEQGKRFRWTEPVALLRLVPPAGGALLRIETGGLHGPPLDHLQGIYVAGEPLAPELISGDDEALEVQLPSSVAGAVAGEGMVLVFRPLVPSRSGSSDRRRLGMPVVELGLRAL